MISRRAFALGALVTSAARADVAEDDLRNLRVLDLREDGRRFLLLTPRYQNRDAPIPLGVFLHGLGETASEALGVYAWPERYGLASAWQRLKRAPLQKASPRGEWTDERLADVNRELAERPFRGFAMACPYMPKPGSPADLDAYAKWLEKVVARCRREVPLFEDRAHTHLCGVSLGGYVSLEVLVRTPDLWGSWAGVQTAIGTFAAPRYAERVAKASLPLLVLTSTQDHWKSSSEALAAAFGERKLPHTLRVIPGPHDQPWLREAGTIEALHWMDRV